MNHRVRTIVVCCIAIFCVREAQASPFRSFEDISEHSPSKRYKVEAQSPDNRPDSDTRFWQSKFVFTCKDTRTGKVLWSRKQGAENEGPPIALFASDAGWAVIRTLSDRVICVDREGAERGTVDLLKDALIGTEYKDYIYSMTGGRAWSGYSLWYFLEADGRNLFVIRPWWGRRIFIDVDLGGLSPSSPAISKAIVAYEHDYVVAELAKGVKNRAEWEKEFSGREGWRLLTAAYLAGVLKITDAIPDLLKLQDSWYLGCSTGRAGLEKFDGEVDPHSYSTFTMRQVVHLSLRRLGKLPEALPVSIFCKHYEDIERIRAYDPDPMTMPRHTNSDAVRKGMKAEEVLDLIGAPDFFGNNAWEYDMDTEPPHSLIVNWDRRRVIGTEKRVPALWQQGIVRDRQVAE